MRKKKRIQVPAGNPKRAPARDAFANALARIGAGMPSLMEGTTYQMQRLTRNYNLLNSLYREHWIMRRIVDIIPGDMLKNWITITTEVDPKALKRIDLVLRRTQLIQKLKTGMQWGRLYGGAVGVMLIKGQGYDLAEPVDLDRIMPGDFCGIMVLDRWNGVSPSGELIGDISDPEYGLPKYYLVTDTVSGVTTKIHNSRVLRFIGDDLPYWESQAEEQWGASVIESVFDELKKRDNVSWNIAQLTFMASLRVLKMNDLGQTLSATDEQTQAELYKTIQAQNWLMSNSGVQVLDKEDGFETHQYTFGGISEVYQQFMMDISGAAQIPATKLFGRAPAGMNATGESDLQNYYDMIGQEQESKLRPILNKLLPILCMSVFGAIPDDLDFDFDPVSEPSDKERSELAKTGTENVVTALNAGLVSKRTALQELKQQSERTGVWTNITDEDIMKASDEIEEEGEFGGFGGTENYSSLTQDNEYTKDPDPDNWKTIKGEKVHIDENGNIDGGAGGKFVGRKFNGSEQEHVIKAVKAASAKAKQFEKPKALHSNNVYDLDDPKGMSDCVDETIKRMGKTGKITSEFKSEIAKGIRSIDEFSRKRYDEIRKDESEYAKEANRSIDVLLENSPSYNGSIYRGISVTKKELNQYIRYSKKGIPFDQKGLSSWSSEKKIADSFIRLDEDRNCGIMFIKEGVGFTNSTSIKHMSAFTEENEVLVHRKTKMKITKYYKHGKTHFFTVEEVNENE